MNQLQLLEKIEQTLKSEKIFVMSKEIRYNHITGFYSKDKTIDKIIQHEKINYSANKK